MRRVIALSILTLIACLPASTTNSPTPAPTIAISATAAPTSTSSPAGSAPLGENVVLGYRISLPVTYRLGSSKVFADQGEMLGRDIYTTLSVAQEQAECREDAGDIPRRSLAGLLMVEAHRNAKALSAGDWLRAHPVYLTHRDMAAVSVGGRDAARLTQQGQVQLYVISANARAYVITPQMWPNEHDLDTIAATFQAIAPPPFPTPAPTPATSPKERAAEMATSLAAAFAAKDADGVAKHMTGCSIGFGAMVGGMNTGGAVNRALANFIPALRQRFADGELSVTVDPIPRDDTRRGGSFYLRSAWIERDRTTSIDLWLNEIEGVWRWTGAEHHYDRYAANNCIPYRSPWITPTPGVCSP